MCTEATALLVIQSMFHLYCVILYSDEQKHNFLQPEHLRADAQEGRADGIHGVVPARYCALRALTTMRLVFFEPAGSSRVAPRQGQPE